MIKVTMMLADHAQAVNGKLYLCGGGWTVTGPDPAPSAIALDIKVPWHQMSVQHKIDMELLDGDGQPVIVDTPEGEQPVKVHVEFEVTPQPGLKPGSELGAVMAVNFPPFPLQPGGMYVWSLSVNGKTNDAWRCTFYTRLAQAQAA